MKWPLLHQLYRDYLPSSELHNLSLSQKSGCILPLDRRKDFEEQLNLTDLEMEEEDYNMVDEDAGAVAFNQHIQTQTTVLLDGAEQTDESILF